jgi:4,5-dihydroxyphthalate decarboxylase
VWARAILQDDHGVKPSDIHWIRGGLEEAGRLEKIAITLPKDVKLDNAPEGRTLSAMLEAGEIDAFMGPRVPSCFTRGAPNVGWLFPDPVAAAKDYFKRTGIFPIMHLVGIRRELADAHPWLPGAVFKAFDRSKTIALEKLADTSSTKVTLPFVEERLIEARALLGDDFWPYGVAANRKTLETFLKHHHAQGLSPRPVKVEELFHPGTLETFKL